MEWLQLERRAVPLLDDGAFAEDFKEVRGLTRWEHIPLLAVGFRQTASIALRPIDCSSRALNLPRRTGH